MEPGLPAIRRRTPAAGTSSPDPISSDTSTLRGSPSPAESQGAHTDNKALVSKLGDLLPSWFTSAVKDGRFDDEEIEKLESYPPGYPRLAAWANLDESFSLYRRFGTLRNRLLFHRQYELVMLEKELLNMDRKDSENERRRITSIHFDMKDIASKRQELIDEIDTKLEHYDQLLDRERASLRLLKPTTRNYRHLINFLWNRKPIARSEMAFLNPRDDFVILTDEPDNRIETYIEKLIMWLLPSKRLFGRILSSKAQREKTTDKFIALADKNRVQSIIRVLVILFIAATLIVPLVLLIKFQANDKTKAIIVLASTLFFATGISLLAVPRNHELFVATATYTAVLVVFLDKAGNATSLKQN